MHPYAKKIPHELTLHGHTRVDPYHWLRDRENPEVTAHLEAENRYTDEVMEPVRELKGALFDEIVARIKKTDRSVPHRFRDHYYYTRTEGKQEYRIHCRKRGSLDAEEQILLDVNELAEGLDYCAVFGLQVSPDDRLLAFGVDSVGRRQHTIQIKDLKTGQIIEDRIPNTVGMVAWANDSNTFFYTEKDPETLRPYLVKKHVMGTDPAGDVEVFREADTAFMCWAYKSKSLDYIMIASESTLTSEVRFLRADDPDGSFAIIQPRQRELEYEASHFDEHFYIRTNLDAKNFRLMRAPVANPGVDHWEEVLPHRTDVLIEGIDVFCDYLVISERKGGLTHLRVRSHDGSEEHDIAFPEPAFSAHATVNKEFDTDLLRFAYTSMVTPWSTFDYNMKTKERELKKQEEVLGGYNPEDYESARITAKAPDGTEIPISLVYAKDGEPKSGRPLVLRGYGSYGLSTDPEFGSARLSLLDRGFVCALAHIRGGEEMGRQWYEDGKLLRKKNTFADFIACAEKLIEEGYAAKTKVYATGGSAGGLLMGAVVNMRPDLFAGICAHVPFVDVVTTMLDESIPLTTGEYDEWGNPNDKLYYDYILSYSPYDNVEQKDYPPMLVTTGLHDSQVQYWEPAKWVAKLRDLKTDDRPVLLHTQMEAGHSGASGRFEVYKDVALEYAFLLQLEGILE
ncbi:MAG: oligopeptidase B [Gemmatimonadetes bacterium]|nr:oligopeptidase B [Gemmatimonadota bacterium]